MIELTSAQCIDLFGMSNRNPVFLSKCQQWNASRHDAPIRVHRRTNIPQRFSYSIVYRDELSAYHLTLLAELESSGKYYDLESEYWSQQS